MKVVDITKGIFASVFAWTLVNLGITAPWVGVLIGMMMLDYITGMTASAHRGEISSRVGIGGILKKMGNLVLVVVGIVVDWIITDLSPMIGLKNPLQGLIALLVILWLVINEIISVLENLHRMGVPMPGFLIIIIKQLHEVVDGKEEETG